MKILTLSSDRIRLRLVKQSDLKFVHMLLSIPEIDQYNTLGIPKDLKETKSFIEPWIEDNQKTCISNYTFVMEQLSDEEAFGLFGLKLWPYKHRRGEVWYKLHPDYWNRGYATESLNRILDFGFGELNLHRIQSGCAVENIASMKVLEKVGMTREGRGRRVLPLISGWSDNYEYAILEDDDRHYFNA